MKTQHWAYASIVDTNSWQKTGFNITVLLPSQYWMTMSESWIYIYSWIIFCQMFELFLNASGRCVKNWCNPMKFCYINITDISWTYLINCCVYSQNCFKFVLKWPILFKSNGVHFALYCIEYRIIQNCVHFEFLIVDKMDTLTNGFWP